MPYRDPVLIMTPGQPVGVDDRVRRLAPLVLAAWVAANHGWTISFGLTNDDFIWIENAVLRNSESLARTLFLPWVWQDFFRPIVQLSFVANVLLAGLHAWPYHLTNVLLHAGNTLLVWRLARVVVRADRPALLVALLFSAHPTTSEAVAWVSGRTELLCTAFYVGAVIMHLDGRPRAGVVFAGCALLTKESAISLPFAIAAGEWLVVRAPGEKAFRRVAPYAILAVLYLCVRAALVRAALLHEFASGAVGLSGIHPVTWENVRFLLRSKVTLMGQYFLEPFPLHGFLRSLIALGGLLFVGFACTQHAHPYRRRALRFGIAWTAITLLPYLGWRAFQGWYVYLAVIGVSMFWVILGAELLQRVPLTIRTTVITIVIMLWLGTAIVRLQINNEHERRAGVETRAIVHGILVAVPSPARGTLFVVSGLALLRLGADRWVGKPVLVYGLPEAVRLWFHDPSLDVKFGEETIAPALTRPVVYLHWDQTTRRFARAR